MASWIQISISNTTSKHQLMSSVQISGGSRVRYCNAAVSQWAVSVKAVWRMGIPKRGLYIYIYMIIPAILGSITPFKQHYIYIYIHIIVINQRWFRTLLWKNNDIWWISTQDPDWPKSTPEWLPSCADGCIVPYQTVVSLAKLEKKQGPFPSLPLLTCTWLGLKDIKGVVSAQKPSRDWSPADHLSGSWIKATIRKPWLAPQHHLKL